MKIIFWYLLNKLGYFLRSVLSNETFHNSASVVSNIEPLDTRSFSLVKLCVRARLRFEKVIFCVLILARNLNARQTFICYLMKLFENVRKSNVRWCSCSKMLKNRRSYLLDTRKIRVGHNTNENGGYTNKFLIKCQ